MPAQTAAPSLSLAVPTGVEVTRQSLTLRADLPYEAWLKMGGQLKDLNAASPWFLGDWLAYGVAKYTSTHWSGKMPEGLYKKLAAQIGLSEQTLANLKCVCVALPPSRRREGLTITHALEIIGRCKDPKVQDRWVAAAVEDGLTVKELRCAIKAAQATAKPETGDRGTTSLLEVCRQFVRDFGAHAEDASPEVRKEAAKILKPVLGRLTRA